jgi:hypothetical protein
MPKNRRVEKRYFEFRDFRWRVNEHEWSEYVRRGFFERVSKRVAVLRRGVDLVWEDGKHLLRDTGRNMEVSIPSSWRLVERASMYDTRGPRLTPVVRQREIQANYCSTFEAWEAA